MSKKRQDLELELRKLDIDRRDVDVRIRSIEESPRNQRILAGDFSRPPPREGDPRRLRGRGKTEAKEASEAAEKEEKEKEEAAATAEEAAPAVSSAVVVGGGEGETKEEAKPARAKRKLGGVSDDRTRRIFSSLLMGNLNKAQKRNKEDRDDVHLKKKEELEAKVREKLAQRTVGMLEKEAEHLAQQRDQDKKLREDIMRKEETKRRELDELIMVEHEEMLGHFIRTQSEPFVYYLPASHTEKTRKLLQKTKEFHEAKVAEGVMLEKDLDEGFIAEIFKPKATEKEGGEEAGEAKAKKGEKEEAGEKEKEKASEKGESSSSSSKKNRKKKADSSSSSSSSDSSSSDSD